MCSCRLDPEREIANPHQLHRAVHQGGVNRLDVAFRKHLRHMVGPPPSIQWDASWHEILHQWNARSMDYCGLTGCPSWFQNCLQQYWKLAQHVTHFSHERWVKRVLAWQPVGARMAGRPRHAWNTSVDTFSRLEGWNDWTFVAHHPALWSNHCEERVNSTLRVQE